MSETIKAIKEVGHYDCQLKSAPDWVTLGLLGAPPPDYSCTLQNRWTWQHLCIALFQIFLAPSLLVLNVSSPVSTEPNDESGANVDASKMWREDREQFYKLAQKIVRKSLGL